jgi:hypothetical protein
MNPTVEKLKALEMMQVMRTELAELFHHVRLQ